MKLFIPITKVDVEKREVWGRAADETPDKANEVFDYAASKPHFEAWSSEVAKATDGKSLGNLRAMHQKIAAGKLIALTCDDAAKAIDIGTKIVDDNEWQKVQEGVYTGFSVGGTYGKTWTEAGTPALKRFECLPSEISLADNPCNPSARFMLVKADGVSEEREFKPAAPAPESVVPVEAPTAEKTVKTAKAPTPGLVLTKGMYAVGCLADLLDQVRYLAEDAQWEADWEGDDSALPGQLREWLGQGATILVAMVGEEASELALAAAAVLRKSAGAPAPAPAQPEALAKVTGELATATAALATVTTERDTLAEKVTKLEAQPAQPKASVRAIAKAEDGEPPVVAEIKPDQNDPLAVMKAVHAAGGTVVKL